MDTESIVVVARCKRCREISEEVRKLSTNRQLQNSHGYVKHSIGNGAAQEFICTTKGHEQWWGDCLREWRLMS